jgi:predicted alpha/beta superfamily hydrolase
MKTGAPGRQRRISPSITFAKGDATVARGIKLPKGAPYKLINAVEFDMTSRISGRTYRIFVHTPFAPPPEGGYPVAYFTDGNLTFPIAAAMGGAFGLGGKPVLVVGVGYPNPLELFILRTRDLTPPTPLANIRAQPGLPPPTAENYGGADDFRRFLVEELRPAILASYPVNAADQTLFGYSLGGLFTLSVLFNHPTAFRTFGAASPSIWWNKRAVLKDEPRLAAAVSGKTAAPRILVTIGADEQKAGAEPPPGMTPAEERKLMREARMVDNARELGERLAALKGAKGYATQFQAFEREDHLTSIAASISRTLAFALRG